MGQPPEAPGRADRIDVGIVTGLSPLALIVGVPRSGTTLVRFLLDSHPEIAAPGETPWIAGSYGSPRSIRHLIEYLEGFSGSIANLGDVLGEDDVVTEARSFVERLLGTYAERTGSSHVVLKTPNDITELRFLHRLFPDTPVIHMIRDGRDVALSSTPVASWAGLGRYGANTYVNALDRWADWVVLPRLAHQTDPSLRILEVRYEALVTDPAGDLQRVCDFLGVAYSPAMLSYKVSDSTLPRWEAGSRDVLRHSGIEPSRSARWTGCLSPRDLARTDLLHGPTLQEFDYPLARDLELYSPATGVAAHLDAWWHRSVMGPLRSTVTARRLRKANRSVRYLLRRL